MLRIGLLLALAPLTLGAPAAQAQTPPRTGIIDRWSGVGHQVGPEGLQSTWTVRVRIRADIPSYVEYPSLGCKGELEEVRLTEDEIEYVEHITEGTCITGGRITVLMREDRLMYFWRKPEEGADASGVLYRESRAVS